MQAQCRTGRRWQLRAGAVFSMMYSSCLDVRRVLTLRCYLLSLGEYAGHAGCLVDVAGYERITGRRAEQCLYGVFLIV